TVAAAPLLNTQTLKTTRQKYRHQRNRPITTIGYFDTRLSPQKGIGTAKMSQGHGKMRKFTDCNMIQKPRNV
ncbi:MAG: hypothetical protein NC324_09635, partial [Bacteroides sp.]|nr:hypothetical protein [Bacteroides sp.]